MNIALNPEATAEKSRQKYCKTSGQFEPITLDTTFPEAARRRVTPVSAPGLLSKQQWKLWRDLLTP